jgi:pimeloyl-ACP methyl ester carboxylesterase
MTPLFFGSSQRRLFGAYEPPRATGRGGHAVLLCQPWGQEYIRAHRSMRRLATLLTAAGCHVMRFDYFGTGDSMGQAREVNFSGCAQDIETAIEELRDTSGATRVVLVGLRLGATLAAHVAARNKKTVGALALWDPVVSGAEYLEELLAGAGDSLTGGDGHNVMGFPLTQTFESELRAIELSQLLAALPARTHLIASTPLASHEKLRAELEQQRSDITLEEVSSLRAWVEHREFGAGAVPTKVLETLVQRVC